ncbi:hypothetical protein EG68_09265 [Paragonimus skrjabini miyazakii]|uniref:Protein kinase domain-containing protein n=1 Tax=Paragonimus skrjabini miyazakii TaxID=59628 RepID=A0A8S9Y8R4_9TREM|nr:hypothetical protein EG68_09265 [Paragonimus skrjabini miyazakii]
MVDKGALLPASVYAAAALARICTESGVPDKVRVHGGIPILLSCLRELTVKNFQECTARQSEETQTMDRLPPEPLGSDSDSPDLKRISQLVLSSAVCSTLGELAFEEFSAQLIVQGNGVHLIGRQLLLAVRKVPQSTVLSNAESFDQDESYNNMKNPENLDKAKGLCVMGSKNCFHFIGTRNLLFQVFRTLKRLYRFERSRRLIKSLLPASLLAELIELEGYRPDVKDYSRLLDRFEGLTDGERCRIIDGVSACDLNKPPTHLIRDYAILELLGSGAFGHVYKARKNVDTPSQTVYAIKEINTTQAYFGRNAQERQKNVGRLLNEVTIIKQQLRHPNIVRYYKTFIHDDRLFIVMEMLEGLSLTELLNSMHEKTAYLEEHRIWRMFIQLVLALRYLHREKGIFHRDLSSNNIMVGEGDKVTLTDFGLARQKQWGCSPTMSTVGTLIYACPEIVQSLPYAEGADIWSLGCVLYQMCAHHPPFQAECILTVASRIVKSEFEPLAKICQYPYSDLVEKVVRACLITDPTKRPDIVGVASHLTDQLLQQLDSSRQTTAQAKRRLKEFRDQFNLSSSLGSMNQSLSHSFGSSTSKLDSRCNSMVDCLGSVQLGQVCH